MEEIRMLDMKSWPRAEHYRHFTVEDPCSFSFTDDVDVTELKRICVRGGPSFHLTFLWLVACAVNAHEEFRMTAVDSPDAPFPMPGVWDAVHPVHNVFHESTQTSTSTFTLFSPDHGEFCARAREDIEKARSLKVMSIPGPANVFETSALPWRHFTSVGVRSDGVSLAPVIVWGGFREERGRTFLPLSVSIAHAAADGFHVSRLIGEIEAAGKAFAAGRKEVFL